MFNSIRKDLSRRKLVKKFEIQKLQNKVIVQAISAINYNISLQNRVNAMHIQNEFCEVQDKQEKDKTLNNLSSFLDKKLVIKSSLHLFAKRKKASYNKAGIDIKVKQDFSIPEMLRDKDNVSSHVLLRNANAMHSVQGKQQTKDGVSYLQSDILINSFQEQNLKSILNKRSIPRNGSKIRVKNRCIETGRARSVLKFCKLSRICLRDKASKGFISGMKKASW